MANYDEANPLVRILPCKGDRGVDIGATVVTDASFFASTDADKTKAYLYCGDTTTNTAGTFTKKHWYYYNGAAWTNGGEYDLAVVDSAFNSDSTNAVQNKVVKAALDALEAQIPEIDDTLTVQGAAAESKTVGDTFKTTLRQLPNITATGHDASEYADESGWRFVEDTAALANYPYSGGGLLMSYVPRGSNIRYQLAVPVNINDTPKWRRRTPKLAWSDWVSYGEFEASAKTNMLALGNSIFTGSVWTMKRSSTNWAPGYDHLSSWGNSPYSVVANRLGILSKNINIHGEVILHSSTGFMYAPSAPSTGEPASIGSLLDIVCGGTVTISGSTYDLSPIDLSDYDYIFLGFFTEDLTHFTLGNGSSTIDDGSLVGGVLKLLNYINQSNPSCRLILHSAPPISMAHYGNEVFTYKYSGGGTKQSISDLDSVMHALADAYNFVYIDWQKMNLSYHYRDFTGGTVTQAMIDEFDSGQAVGTRIYNVHLNNENSYRRMGLYLAEQIEPEAENKFAILDDSVSEDVSGFYKINNKTIVSSDGLSIVQNKNKFDISGTATAGVGVTIFGWSNIIPLNPGETYFFDFRNPDNLRIAIRFIKNVSGTETTVLSHDISSENIEFTVPNDEGLRGFYIRLYFVNEVTYSGSFRIYIRNALTAKQITEYVDTVNEKLSFVADNGFETVFPSDYSAKTQTKSDVTCTVHDGTITLDGTTSSSVWYTVMGGDNTMAGLKAGESYILEWINNSAYKIGINAYYKPLSGSEVAVYPFADSDARSTGLYYFRVPNPDSGMRGFWFRIWWAASETAKVFDNEKFTFRIYKYLPESEVAKRVGSETITTPLLSIIDDDGAIEFYNSVVPLVEDYNVSLASAVPAEFPGRGYTDFMNWEQVEDAFSRGAEILCHGLDHTSYADVSSMTKEELEHDFTVAKNRFFNHNIPTGNIMIYQFSSGNLTSVRSAAAAAMRVGIKSGGSKMAYRGVMDRYNIPRYGLGLHDGWLWTESTDAGGVRHAYAHPYGSSDYLTDENGDVIDFANVSFVGGNSTIKVVETSVGNGTYRLFADASDEYTKKALMLLEGALTSHMFECVDECYRNGGWQIWCTHTSDMLTCKSITGTYRTYSVYYCWRPDEVSGSTRTRGTSTYLEKVIRYARGESIDPYAGTSLAGTARTPEGIVEIGSVDCGIRRFIE